MRNPSLLVVLTCLPITVQAQHQPSFSPDSIRLDRQPGKQVTISSSPGIRRYKGSVRLRQQGILLFCDRAIHQLATNSISAAGHVLLVQHDSLTVKSDSLFYDGINQRAMLTGHVLLQTGRSVLTTTQLEYDLRTGKAHYKGKGRIATMHAIQTMSDGFYDVRTKQLTANQSDKDQPDSKRNVPNQVANVDATTVTRLREDNRPQRLTTAINPQLNNIATKPESVGTYKQQVRVVQRPLQTAVSSTEQTTDESDLEHLLNRKKRVF